MTNMSRPWGWKGFREINGWVQDIEKLLHVEFTESNFVEQVQQVPVMEP
jgi:hypothetical protein